jgi:hypothetical protein
VIEVTLSDASDDDRRWNLKVAAMVPSRRLLENVGGASGVMTVLAQAARSIALPDVG